MDFRIIRIFLLPVFGLALSFLIGGCAVHPPRQSGHSKTQFDFALIGDVPYTPEAVSDSFPNLIDDLNRSELTFVVHDGDIKSGSAPCTDDVLLGIYDQFQTIRAPLIYVFGDNEWTDCGNNSDQPFDPEERLDKLREIFTKGDQSLGRRTLTLTRQSQNPPFEAFRENVRWIHGGILFVGLNITGSQNNFGKPEFGKRNAAALAWTRESFALARKEKHRAIMLVIQANPRFESPPEDRPGFQDFLVLLEQETIAFQKPVVLVHGDSHYFRIDKPMKGSRSQRRVENFTRVETFGNPDAHWLQVTVDLSDPAIFTFRQRIVEKNRVNHD